MCRNVKGWMGNVLLRLVRVVVMVVLGWSGVVVERNHWSGEFGSWSGGGTRSRRRC